MGTLEQVMQLRGQGMSDEQISSNLQQQGVAPKEITDAINQANVKTAVSGEDPSQQTQTQQNPAAQAPAGNTGGGTAGGYTPQTQDYSQEAAQQNYGNQGYADQGQEYYQESGYGTAPAAGTSPDTMIELANQVFSEKIRKTSKAVNELNEFKTTAQVKLDNLEERMKKIEKIIDTIQIKVLEKVGEFSSELRKTQKEVEMVEDSFSKMHKKKSSSHSKKKTSKKK